MDQKIIVSAMPALAAVTGLLAFKKLTLFYRIILFQVMLYLVVLYLTYQVAQKNIHTIYNFYIPIETGLLMIGGYILFPQVKERILILTSFALFLLVYLKQITGGLKIFANFASVVEGASMTIIYLSILKIDFSRSPFTWHSSAIFWLSLGSAIYFGGTLPLLSIINFANEHFEAENSMLFRAIVDVLANVRYLSITISFALIYKTNTKALKGTV